MAQRLRTMCTRINYIIVPVTNLNAGPNWPRGLRHRSEAVRLLRSWVRIPPGYGCLSVVSIVCCQVEVSATS